MCALLHDVGDLLGSWNHPEVSAAILKPFVSEANHWMVEKHGIFQGYNFFQHINMDRNMREQFRGHPHFERTARFVELYDNPAFDPRPGVSAARVLRADGAPRVRGAEEQHVPGEHSAVRPARAAASILPARPAGGLSSRRLKFRPSLLR